jgi:superfamily II DNA/RNA helicase
MPAVSMKLLTGDDGVDRWSKRIWDTALLGIKVVVSTHAVLADVLSHGFLHIEQLALLVFDEGCSKILILNSIERN